MDAKLKQLQEKLETLEKACVLIKHREQHLEELYRLHQNVTGVKESISECRKMIQEHLESVKQKYEEVLKKSRVVQLQMLYLLEHLPDEPIGSAVSAPAHKTRNTVTSSLPKPVAGTPSANTGTMPKPQIDETPHRMKIDDYGKSPFVNRKKPVKLEFLDFEAEITQEHFAKIPAYMRGRETLEDLKTFLQSILVPCLTSKYSLMYKKRTAIPNQQDIEIWKMYREQQETFPNLYFVTEGDISRQIGRLVDKKMSQKIQMLRHLGILREIRKGKTTYFVWIN